MGRDAMKTYIANLPMRLWLLLVLTALLLAYPVVRMAVPVLVHAAVPDVVRTVLGAI